MDHVSKVRDLEIESRTSLDDIYSTRVVVHLRPLPSTTVVRQNITVVTGPGVPGQIEFDS